MKNIFTTFLALVFSGIVVHILYVSYIWPEADQALAIAKQAGISAPRDLAVILKDTEQEICFILMLWGFLLIIGKSWQIVNEWHLYSVDLLGNTADPSETLDTKEALKKTLHEIEELSDTVVQTPLIQTLINSIRRYLITNDVHSTSEAITLSVDALAMRQEAENTVIRYIIWAIPSIGFIGTVRGIGLALSQADEALAGDISGMTDSLGVAFNSTLVALVISIFMMLFLHSLQRLQDGQLVKTQSYCDDFFIKRITK
ncbi:MotA/TolQ/ExbB proton channel family protein [Sneathiella aquimaris]|uniref:MotA/TolQ/ExbB proton channel family protein n=1 Tax=Sneathiella aquimaris TaxID=2599305 RepID=UPI00146B63A8|nr:MotA/TolQ/ExbB proton channel family protein [Sneathiella aquimaris]